MTGTGPEVLEDINVRLCIYTHTVYICSLVLYVHQEVCTFICLRIYTHTVYIYSLVLYVHQEECTFIYIVASEVTRNNAES